MGDASLDDILDAGETTDSPFGDMTDGEGDAASGSGYTCITLLYGTNREAQTDFGERLDHQEAFTVRLDPTCEPGRVAVGTRYCHLGLLTVTVPDSRQRGDRINAVPRDAIRVTDRQRRRLISVWNYEPLDENEFSALAFDMLADAVGQMDGEFNNQVIVFIHGFNVRFRDAAFRAAQIKYDLDSRARSSSIPGQPMAVSCTICPTWMMPISAWTGWLISCGW
ncbi:alpha/beta hydrolase [Maricaulis sp.]|uniref:alpha/beta hydrolase n=1 Tax=Maricaulis sp. TaxID=1486257 RepID=UPI0025B85434|nr:alpha/beta hydrolase [Maricaulis sp.]